MKYENSVAILGSTGSIGTQALEVCKNLGIKVTALSAHRNTKLLEMQAREFKPYCVCIADESLYSDISTRLADTDIKILCGKKGLSEIASLSYC
ncbi:MAG: 1-deoxy-D-xylulose-5-phosphate reductoisomerase, partial [Oscillospiraceae bacterium]|nr:1-deoxy-D-xylulose-5-phosphate reductoisomerase [Oscillospiraceae bacterium]